MSDHHGLRPQPPPNTTPIRSYSRPLTLARTGFDGPMLMLLADEIRSALGSSSWDSISVTELGRSLTACPYDDGQDLATGRTARKVVVRLGAGPTVELTLHRRFPRRGRLVAFVQGWEETDVGGVVEVVNTRTRRVRKATRHSLWGWLKTSNWSVAVFGGAIATVLATVLLGN